MKHTNETIGEVALIRPAAGRAPRTQEALVSVSKRDGTWVGRILAAAAPPLGQTCYLVPTGELDHPVDLDGAPFEVRVEETGETVKIFPIFRILSVALDGTGTLASILHEAPGRHLPEIRRQLEGIFKTTLGQHCAAKNLDFYLDPSGSKQAAELQTRIERKTGLTMDWWLEPEPCILAWIRSVQQELPAMTSLVFNQESTTAQFKLTMAMKVVRALPSGFHLLQRRARTGMTPDQEKQQIFKRIFDILNPAFGIVGGRDDVWRHPLFWSYVRAGLNEVVKPRLAEEFGYEVEFHDLKRERGEAELEALMSLQSRERLTLELTTRDNIYRRSLENLTAELESEAYNFESPHVQKAQNAVERARQDKEAAEQKLVEDSKGRGMEVALEDASQFIPLLDSFGTRLGLGGETRDQLRLEADGDRGNTTQGEA